MFSPRLSPFVLVLLALGCTTTRAPEGPAAPAGHPVPGADAVVIHTDEPPTEAFRTLQRLFADAGLDLEEDLLRLRLSATQRERLRRTVRYDAQCRDLGRTEIVLSGVVLGHREVPDRPLVFAEDSPQLAHRAFRDLVALAQSYPGATVRYARR